MKGRRLGPQMSTMLLFLLFVVFYLFYDLNPQESFYKNKMYTYLIGTILFSVRKVFFKLITFIKLNESEVYELNKTCMLL